MKSLENNVQYYAWHIVKMQFMFVEWENEGNNLLIRNILKMKS